MSPYLFLLAIEPLLTKIREKIPGIDVYGVACKLFGFADDLQVWVNSREELSTLLDILKQYARESGLKVNCGKCEILGLGLAHDETEIEGIKTTEEMKITGITLSKNTSVSCAAREGEKIITAMENCVRDWEDRKLSLMGKSVLIKSKIYGTLNHVMQHALLPPSQFTKIDRLVSRFLWKGPRLLPVNQMARVKEEGGLGIIPAETKNNIMLAQWFKLLRHGNELWCEAIKAEINKLGG